MVNQGNRVQRPLLAAPSGPLVVGAYAAPAAGLLSLVVPTFNERDTVRDLLLALRDVLDSALPTRYEVIVVDDNSPDRTWEICAAMLTDWPALRVMRRERERGLASAVIRGWQVAEGEILGTINADLQHPPTVLARMIPQMAAADLVVASRYAQGGGLGNWGLLRRFTSRSAHVFGRVLLPSAFGRTSDPLSGCYLFRRSGIAGVELQPLGFKTLIEIMVRGRFGAVAECSYEMRERLRGRSKASPRHSFDYLRQLLRLRAAAREKRLA